MICVFFIQRLQHLIETDERVAVFHTEQSYCWSKYALRRQQHQDVAYNHTGRQHLQPHWLFIKCCDQRRDISLKWTQVLLYR